MDAEAYRQQYLGVMTPAVGAAELPHDSETEAVLPELAAAYYYPPGPAGESYLDVLSRAELLALLWQLLAVDYPQQRLTRRHVGQYGEFMHQLKQDQAWRQAEMERLSAEQTQRQAHIALLEAEQQRLDTEVRARLAEVAQWQAAYTDGTDRIAELERQCAELQTILADLRTSTSWKLTAPLRRVSRSLNAWRAPEV